MSKSPKELKGDANNMKAKTIVAILCITALLSLALLKGFDGALLTSGVAVIAGLAGFAVGKSKSTK